jgi:hypothetical protein
LFRSHESWLQKDSICALRNESGFVLYRWSRIHNVFKRFVSWIRFVDLFWKIRFVDLFLKDLFCGFILWKQKFQITRFVLFRKDSCTNPASLKNSPYLSKHCWETKVLVKLYITNYKAVLNNWLYFCHYFLEIKHSIMAHL